MTTVDVTRDDWESCTIPFSCGFHWVMPKPLFFKMLPFPRFMLIYCLVYLFPKKRVNHKVCVQTKRDWITLNATGKLKPIGWINKNKNKTKMTRFIRSISSLKFTWCRGFELPNFCFWIINKESCFSFVPCLLSFPFFRKFVIDFLVCWPSIEVVLFYLVVEFKLVNLFCRSSRWWKTL